MLAMTVFAGLGLTAVGQTSTRNTLDRGWYSAQGEHDSFLKIYAVGNAVGSTILRNWFVVDLTGVTQPVVSARLLLRNPSEAVEGGDGFSSGQASETYALFDVSTPITDLRATQTIRTDIFADLGSGASFGSFVATAGSNGTDVSISLNSAGLASLNAARGGLWAVGGAITTINSPAGSSDELLFNFSSNAGAGDGKTRLELTVPTPGTAGLLGMAGVLAAGRRRRA